MSFLIQAANVSDITKKLEAQLLEWPYLKDNGARVVRAAPINKDSGATPWVGIYRQQQMFEARTLGLGSGYRRHNITFALVIQESSMVDGATCEDRMERLVSEVVSAICSDESIRGSVVALAPEPFMLTYSSYQVEGNSFYQEAVLLFTVTTNVSAQEAG